MRPLNNRSGFTLLELMVATAVATIVTVTGYEFMAMFTKASSEMAHRSFAETEIQALLQSVKNEVRYRYSPNTGEPPDIEPLTTFQGKPSAWNGYAPTTPNGAVIDVPCGDLLIRKRQGRLDPSNPTAPPTVAVETTVIRTVCVTDVGALPIPNGAYRFNESLPCAVSQQRSFVSLEHYRGDYNNPNNRIGAPEIYPSTFVNGGEGGTSSALCARLDTANNRLTLDTIMLYSSGRTANKQVRYNFMYYLKDRVAGLEMTAPVAFTPPNYVPSPTPSASPTAAPSP